MPPPGPSVTAPAHLGHIAGRVEGRLRSLLDTERDRWSLVDPALGEPFDALSALVLGGGKRLRPAFCHWAFVGAGGDPDDPAVVDAGASLELLHAFALLHDDVMDGSAQRRGRPTAHLRFSGLHDDGRWRGEARRFGEGVAILVGDLAFVYADTLVADAPRPARDVFDELRLELNVGQYLDLLGAASGGVDLDSARRIASYKSGKYTIERPLHLGAALAGRLDALREPLSAYGLPLGEAFQLRDDLLGAFGDSAVTGKPVGDDFREGKPTPLLAIAIDRADAAQRRVLDTVGRRDLDGDEVARLQEVLVATGARDEVEGVIARLLDQAVAAVPAARLGDDASEALVELAHYVAWRDR